MSQQDTRINALATLLELERRTREAETIPALWFHMVNETNTLLPYRQALLWSSADNRVACHSSLSTIDRDSPFILWMSKVFRWLEQQGRTPEGPSVKRSPGMLLEPESLPAELRADWAEWLPARALWMPVATAKGVLLGGLFLARDMPFSEHDLPLAEHLCQAYAYSWKALDRRNANRLTTLRRKKYVLALVLLLLAACFIPVRISALGEAEVDPRDPLVVRSPMDGVVEEIVVEPNTWVDQDQLIARLDRSRQENELAISTQRRLVAEAEYRRAAQRAMFDQESKAELAVLQAQLELRIAEERYLSQMLEEMSIHAGRPGVVVYSAPDDWEGRPVQTGERILSITEPSSVKLSIYLPVEDAIVLRPGAEVLFFLATAPASPLSATVDSISHKPEAMPDGAMAYRIEALFDQGVGIPRLGLTGTAKIYGERVLLAYYLLRRPLAFARRTLGL